MCENCVKENCCECTTVYGNIENSIVLNNVMIDMCNNVSQFDAGDAINREAQKTYKKFFELFPKLDIYTDEQKKLIDNRAYRWKKLIGDAYTDRLNRRANYVPVNVAGPSKYNYKKMNALADKGLDKAKEWIDKIDCFLENTGKMIEDLTPIEIVLDKIRKGKIKNLIIQTGDSYAVEKLAAKLEYHTNLQETMKSMNVYYRKFKTMKGYKDLSDDKAQKINKNVEGGYNLSNQPFPPYTLTNNNSVIRNTQKRLDCLISHKKEKIFKKYEFDGGVVKPNYEIERLQIIFDIKPNAEIRYNLKMNGFKWAPSQSAWQRNLNKNADRAARIVLEK